MVLNEHMQAARTDANPRTAACTQFGRAQPEASAKRLPVAEPVGDPRQVRQAMLEGEPVFTACRRFTVYRLAGGLMSVDGVRAGPERLGLLVVARGRGAEHAAAVGIAGCGRLTVILHSGWRAPALGAPEGRSPVWSPVLCSSVKSSRSASDLKNDK